MVTPTFFDYLSIAKRKNVLSLILWKIQKRKNRQMLCKSRCAVSLRLLKIEHFFFLQLIANQKIMVVKWRSSELG